MSTFTWVASFGAAKKVAPRVRKAAFGDGYEQRVGDGLHTQLRVWTLPFNNRSQTDADAIEAFLIASAGVTAFDWTDCDGHAGKWICDEWSRSKVESPSAARLHSISATFREVIA